LVIFDCFFFTIRFHHIIVGNESDATLFSSAQHFEFFTKMVVFVKMERWKRWKASRKRKYSFSCLFSCQICFCYIIL
jgi:hypothetical protein